MGISMGQRILDVQYSHDMGRGLQRLLSIRQCAMTAYQTAKKTAAKRGVSFCFTEEEMRNLILRSDWRCMVTGIPFRVITADISRASRRPWAPSLDRINSAGGYDRENCRLVCVSVNLAMNEWGENVLFGIVRGLARHRPDKFKAVMDAAMDGNGDEV